MRPTPAAEALGIFAKAMVITLPSTTSGTQELPLTAGISASTAPIDATSWRRATMTVRTAARGCASGRSPRAVAIGGGGIGAVATDIASTQSAGGRPQPPSRALRWEIGSVALDEEPGVDLCRPFGCLGARVKKGTKRAVTLWARMARRRQVRGFPGKCLPARRRRRDRPVLAACLWRGAIVNRQMLRCRR